MTELMARHPAKFNTAILNALRGVIAKYGIEGLVVDPFAGVGRIHELRDTGVDTAGIELEREWASQHPDTICGDMLEELPMLTPDAIITSPAYGNRMADGYAGDSKGSRRHTYRVYLGRELSEGNGGGMQWGREYREFHEQAWQVCWDVLDDGGWLIVNVKDHVRGGELQQVPTWHLRAMLGIGFRFVGRVDVGVTGVRDGQNHNARADGEVIWVMRKPPHPLDK